MREIPKDLQIYKHFKGSLYQIVTIAVHTETTEKMVIYRSLKNPERVFARPLDMFLSEVNHKKYPDVKAKYRFTLLDEAEEEREASVTEESDDNNGTGDAPVINPLIEKILDSKEYSDKIEAFELLRGKCDDDMLSTLAVSLDIQLSGNTVDEKYADILKCLKMHQKYETNRLR